MTALLSPNAKQVFLDNAGNPAAGYKLFTYAANTTTPQETFTNRAGTVANTNPIILDARGEATIYLTPGVVYDYVLETPLGSPVWTREDVSAQAGEAGAVFFTQSGAGAVPRTLEARGRDTLHAADFGVVGDGSTDNSAGLQAAIARAVTLGGARILLPEGVIVHTQPIVISESNITLVGRGYQMAHDAGTAQLYGTALYYAGTVGGVAVTFATTAGASVQKRIGGGLEDLSLISFGQAGTNLLVRSWNGATFRNVFASGGTSVCVQVDVISGSLAEAKDTQRNTFENVQVEAAGSAVGFYLEGDAIANASFNRFIQCAGRHANGTMWKLGNSDNNVFLHCGGFRVAGGTGLTLDLLGASGGNAPARSNRFEFFSGNGGITARGTASYTLPSTRNMVHGIDKDNGSPNPTIETGADLVWSTDTGYRYRDVLIGSVFADDATVAGAVAARGTETVRVANASQNHARYSDGVNEWGINIDGAGNFRFLRIAGSGAMHVPYYASAPFAIVAAATGTLAHGLGRTPSSVSMRLTCLTAEAGYSVGDVVPLPVGPQGGTSKGVAVVQDATNLTYRIGSDAAINLLHKTTGAVTPITPANWNVSLVAFP